MSANYVHDGARGLAGPAQGGNKGNLGANMFIRK